MSYFIDYKQYVVTGVETVQSSPQSPKSLTGTGTAVPPKLWALSLLQSRVLFSPYVFLPLLSFLLNIFKVGWVLCLLFFLLPLLSFLLDIFFCVLGVMPLVF